jgi:antirestriction protein ArdC
MNIENIKKVTNQAIEKLIEALNAGKSEALTNYLAAVAKFHHYSFQNILLIARQCPEATRVAGFHTWRSLGRYVRKGEKGLMILAPLVWKNAAADERTSEQETRIFGFRAVYVFDVSQTEGAPLPTIGVVEGEPGEYFSRLEQLVREQGITLEYSTEIAPAKGMSSGKKIILLPGMAPAEQFLTLVHELAHEMLHRDARRTQTTQRVRETEAEAVAFVVSRGIGLNTNSAAQDYISLYSGDATLLVESLEYIQQTANQILNSIGAESSSAPPANYQEVNA